QGHVEAASTHLKIHIEGVPTVIDGEADSMLVLPEGAGDPMLPVMASPIVVGPNAGGQVFHRLSPLPLLREREQ
ncbi:MAG TPA: integrase, partial [Cupriavidus sp.]|nr:integrase [Cupriavidus sp.]